MKFEFRSGRKVVKTVSTSDEVNTIMRKLIKVRNDDTMWEIIEKTIGNNVEVVITAEKVIDKIMGTTIDIFNTMSVWVGGKKVRTIWTRGF